jgi:predicted unusual protein kinase regulating ubiquinone biosynthesis (AarF/ABC1/UbiB family)
MKEQLEQVRYGVDVPYKEAAYDPSAADAFFRARPLPALRRLAQLIFKSSGFIAAVILDKKLRREEQMVEQRSQELLQLVTSLGPTSIKVGQALSTRTDLLPAAYAAGLTGLQDAVPPFSGEVGRAVIEQELGLKIDDVFSELSLEPVASASIGQVYKGRLRETGELVAVKVQRPRVLANVALDLYMMRRIAPLWKRFQDINTDLVGLVDVWGHGFVNELDYKKEAAATVAFSAAMRERGLGSVFAPEVVHSLSSTHVLTTKWVDGERLASSNAADVPRLCGVALNAYLTMLLDTGTLHCDPHPGNLLRTPDGRLCILDWGMVIRVPQDLQLSLLEFIANLSAENYEEVPNDLVKLSFVPADKIDELRASGLTFAISAMLKLAAEGGGPKGAMQRMVAQNKQKYAAALAEFDDLDSPEATKVRQRLFREDWQRQMAEDAKARAGDGGGRRSSTTGDIAKQVEMMQQQNADVFAIPDYFVYMSRAFATLEGIGLGSDPNYSILKECFPYLAKRLLSDDSPRARGALRMLLYGTGDELNLSKLRDVTDGLESYTVSTSSAESRHVSSSSDMHVSSSSYDMHVS